MLGACRIHQELILIGNYIIIHSHFLFCREGKANPSAIVRRGTEADSGLCFALQSLILVLF